LIHVKGHTKRTKKGKKIYVRPYNRKGNKARDVPVWEKYGRYKTKHGEPTRRFGNKRYRLEMNYAYKDLAKRRARAFRELGYLVRMTKESDGDYYLWIRRSKSRL